MVDQWAAAQRLQGKWEGPATGRPGTGQQVRELGFMISAPSIPPRTLQGRS